MSDFKYTPNSNGKFEFEFAKEIGLNKENSDRISHRFALNTIKSFADTFGVTDEKMTLEGNIPTFVKLLGDVLFEYEDIIIEYKTSNHLPENLRD